MQTGGVNGRLFLLSERLCRIEFDAFLIWHLPPGGQSFVDGQTGVAAEAFHWDAASKCVAADFTHLSACQDGSLRQRPATAVLLTRERVAGNLYSWSYKPPDGPSRPQPVFRPVQKI